MRGGKERERERERERKQKEKRENLSCDITRYSSMTYKCFFFFHVSFMCCEPVTRELKEKLSLSCVFSA
jgi:hypothetical protein